jgi:hypothetical protein
LQAIPFQYTLLHRFDKVLPVFTLQWMVTGGALLVAFLAFLRTRRISRQLDRLTESYWELRYDYGQLRARVSRLEGQPEAPAAPAQPAAAASSTSFVPLASLKK